MVCLASLEEGQRGLQSNANMSTSLLDRVGFSRYLLSSACGFISPRSTVCKIPPFL
jgi:hypothetical protein